MSIEARQRVLGGGERAGRSASSHRHLDGPAAHPWEAVRFLIIVSPPRDPAAPTTSTGGRSAYVISTDSCECRTNAPEIIPKGPLVRLTPGQAAGWLDRLARRVETE